eukprot:119662-Amphidinium_carterae.1
MSPHWCTAPESSLFGKQCPSRALLALLPGRGIRWMKAHQKQEAVDRGMVTVDDLHGNGQADVLANQRVAAHGPSDPDVNWTEQGSPLWKLVGPQLRERPETEPRVRFPAKTRRRKLMLE